MTNVDRKLHQQAIPGSSRPAPHIPPRRSKAHRIAGDAEAIAIAKELAAEFAHESVVRDRQRRLPIAEIERFSQSGLWGITVPKAHGGAGVSFVTVGEVIKLISAADSSLGQIPQNHLGVLDLLRLTASDE